MGTQLITVNALPKTATEADAAVTRIVVVGAGPVGARCAKELLARFSTPCRVELFSDEAFAPYDRIQLSQLLAREVAYPSVFIDLSGQPAGHQDSSLTLQSCAIEAIDPALRTVVDSQQRVHPYDHLILATGSRPHVPHIDGVQLSGVYTFRNLRDAEALLARRSRSRHTVVVGGGLLGLEAAKALRQHNTYVTVVHQSSRLMNRQLNEATAALLLDAVRAQGVDVIIGDGLREITGNQRVAAIVTRSGRRIECDSVVLCTGIKPNIELAAAAGIKFSRGIVVDDKLQTSMDGIYAIGECTEFREQIVGLVSPGLEQALVLATNLAGGTARYTGAQPHAKLKIMNVAVGSLGEVADLPKRPKLKSYRYGRKRGKQGALCRSLVLEKGKLLGACAVGDWPEMRHLRDAFVQQRRIFPWQVLWFLLFGKLWLFKSGNDVGSWPAQAVVCQCNQVTKGTVEASIASGAVTVTEIAKVCGAGAVCGSCRPLIGMLIERGQARGPAPTGSRGRPAPTGSTIAFPVLCFASFIGLFAGLSIGLIPGISQPASVREFSLGWLWTDSLYKQISGFSLLGITLIGLTLSLRKRLRWEFLGDFRGWRLLHGLLGVVALGILLLHTGANLGNHLNRWLMINYLLAAVIGAVLGMLVSISTYSPLHGKLRTMSFWVHVLTVWPLPVLVSAHIVSAYYF